MAAIVFPTSPTNGQEFTDDNEVVWVWKSIAPSGKWGRKAVDSSEVVVPTEAITISDTPPTNTNVLWFDPTDGSISYWDETSGVWVAPANNPGDGSEPETTESIIAKLGGANGRIGQSVMPAVPIIYSAGTPNDGDLTARESITILAEPNDGDLFEVLFDGEVVEFFTVKTNATAPNHIQLGGDPASTLVNVAGTSFSYIGVVDSGGGQYIVQAAANGSDGNRVTVRCSNSAVFGTSEFPLVGGFDSIGQYNGQEVLFGSTGIFWKWNGDIYQWESTKPDALGAETDDDRNRFAAKVMSINGSMLVASLKAFANFHSAFLFSTFKTGQVEANVITTTGYYQWFYAEFYDGEFYGPIQSNGASFSAMTGGHRAMGIRSCDVNGQYDGEIEYLELSSQSITACDFVVVDGSTSALEYLLLEGNQLTNLPNLSSLVALVGMDVSGNMLTGDAVNSAFVSLADSGTVSIDYISIDGYYHPAPSTGPPDGLAAIATIRSNAPGFVTITTS